MGEKKNLHLLSKIIITDSNVDDLLTGAGTITEAKEIDTGLIEILALCGIQLRKWALNDPQAIEEEHNTDITI